MEFTLLWAALTAVGFAWLGTRIWPERLPDHATDRMVGAAAAGLLVGRLSAMLLQGTNPLSNPGDILIVRGGVHTGTATAAAIATYLWSAKWKVAYLDATSPAALMGLGGWHAGCLWRNACLGSGSELPWAWAQEGSLITRHPVELYTAVGLMIAAWLVSRLPWRLLTKSGVALASAGLVRLLTEPMRPSITGGPVGWYIAAIVIGLAAAIIGPRFSPRPSSPT
jgi:hypothetical protein